MNPLQVPALKLGGRLASGYYFYTSGPRAVTPFQCVADTLYLTPWIVPHQVTLSRIGAEVTTVGGGSTLHRPAVYLSDPTTGLPGSLVLDPGTFGGNLIGMNELTVSQVVSPGIVWTGGVNQGPGGAPIMRCGNDAAPVAVPCGTSIPATGLTVVGVTKTGVTGALPGTFGTPSGFAVVATVPRIFVKVA